MMLFLSIVNLFLVLFLYRIFRKKIMSGFNQKIYTNFMKLRLKDRVILSSFSGKSFSDNPKYLYLKIKEIYPEMETIWILDDIKTKIPGKTRKIKRNSIKHFYYMATSKYWIFNSRIPALFKKREEQIYLQTWHGTPYKKLGLDMDVAYFGGGNYKLNFYKNAQRWDYLISPNKYSTKIFQSAFGISEDIILEYGYPRNDILHEISLEKVNSIKSSLLIPSDKKVILYCPTWRDDKKSSNKNYQFDVEMDLNRLKVRFGSSCVILMRMHYLISEFMDLSEFEGFAYDVSSYDDIQELYIISDLMVTDYSSTMFDYAYLGRPIILYMYDFDKYTNTLRGGYFDIKECNPGCLAYDQNELESMIELKLNGSDGVDKEFYRIFCEKQHTSSEMVLNKLF